MHILVLGVLYGCVFRLGSGAGGSIANPNLVKLQTLHQEPNTATAFGPTPATKIGSTTQSATSDPIPAPGPTPAGALRGTRKFSTSFQYFHHFQYSHNLSAGITKESSIATMENATDNRYPNSIRCNLNSELFGLYQETFFQYSDLFSLYCLHPERDLKHSERDLMHSEEQARSTMISKIVIRKC